MALRQIGLLGGLRLLTQPGFLRLWLAQGISEVGDWVTNVALMLLIVRLLGHPGAAALVLLAKLLPRVLVYPFGGVLADKLDRRLLMIATCLVRGGLALSLLLVQTPEHVWWVFLATSLSQVLASLFNPAAMAVVPSLVPAERLGTANGLISAAKEVAFFVGPLGGVAAIAIGDVPLAFVFDALTFIAAAALLLRVSPGSTPGMVAEPLDINQDLRLGWQTVRGHATLSIVFGAQVLVGTMIAALNALLVPLLVMHWQAPDHLLGILYAAVGAGCLVGSLIAMRLPAGSYVRATLGALGLMGLTALSLGLLPWLTPGLALLVVAGIATMIGDIASGTYIQVTIADDRLGRVFGLLFWLVAIGQAFGASLGYAASSLSPAALVIILGSLLLLATAWLVLRLQAVRRRAFAPL